MSLTIFGKILAIIFFKYFFLHWSLSFLLWASNDLNIRIFTLFQIPVALFISPESLFLNLCCLDGIIPIDLCSSPLILYFISILNEKTYHYYLILVNIFLVPKFPCAFKK